MKRSVVWLVLPAAILLWMEATAQNSPVFFISAPDTFYHGREESVSVNLIGINAAVTIELYMQDYPGRTNTFSKVQTTIQRDSQPQSVSMKVLPENLPDLATGDPGRYLYMVAKGVNTPEQFQQETVVLVSYVSHHVFVQTDKPIYTPRQKVNARVFVTDHNMRPADTPIRLDLVNSQGIIIDRQDNKRPIGGIISTDFTLPVICLTGNWALVASYGHQYKENITSDFEVEEYVLPTFSVEVTSPNYILPSTNVVLGRVEATHVYGEPVDGDVYVEFGIVKYGVMTLLLKKSGTLNMNGIFTYDVNVDELVSDAFDLDELPGSILHIEATVSERATGKRQTVINRNAMFATSPYTVHFTRSSQFFKPGLPYLARINVKYANGQPAHNVALQVTAKAKRGSETVDILRRDEAGADNVHTDDQGRWQITLDSGSGRGLEEINVEVKTNDPELNDQEQGVGKYKVLPYTSPSNSYMLVRPRTPVVQTKKKKVPTATLR